MFAFKGNKTEEGKCKKTGKNNAEKNEEKDRFRKVREEGSEVTNKRRYRQFF